MLMPELPLMLMPPPPPRHYADVMLMPPPIFHNMLPMIRHATPPFYADDFAVVDYAIRHAIILRHAVDYRYRFISFIVLSLIRRHDAAAPA